MVFSSSDTIFALSSGGLPSGLAIIRLSGPLAASVLRQIAGILPRPRMATLRPFRSLSGDTLDQGLALYFPGPNSATGEECAEFHCHGGRSVVAGLMQAISAVPGCRLAEPGEFTRRAFLNGKYDLVQVEALADLIDAETQEQRRLAIAGFQGRTSLLYEGWRNRIIEARAHIEAELDFSDERDVPEDISSAVWPDLVRIDAEISEHLAGADAAEIVREGFRVVIMGPPNAGKSSLLNALARRDVAIVSDEPGTTRDLVEVSLDLGGRKVVATDTAGIREAAGKVEAIGMERAYGAAAAAHMTLWLNPAGEEPPSNDIPDGAIRLVSKSDIGGNSTGDGQVAFSSRSGAGLDDVLRLIETAMDAVPHRSGLVPARLRHVVLLQETHACLRNAIEDISAPLEVRAEHLRLASQAIGRIVGAIDVEDLLDRIFGSFCIGK